MQGRAERTTGTRQVEVKHSPRSAGQDLGTYHAEDEQRLGRSQKADERWAVGIRLHAGIPCAASRFTLCPLVQGAGVRRGP